MLRSRVLVVSLPLLAAASLGCSRSADSCDNLLSCPEYAIRTAPEGCDGPADQNVDYYTERCGVFVDPESGSGAGAGTRSAPLDTMSAAIAAAIDQKKRVYACQGTFKETVSIGSSVEIVGGLDCAGGWVASDGARTVIEGLVDTIALTIDTPGYVSLRGIDVVAPAAVAEGASSIAVLVHGAHVTLEEARLAAGDAAAGVSGVEHDADPALDGLAGEAGRAVCEGSSMNPGGEAVTKECGGHASTGGKGGDGGAVNGFSLSNGENGESGGPASGAESGGGGLGEGQAKAASCTSGAPGAAGADGDMGAGATGRGSLTETGYWGEKGEDGERGATGRGGGGGGGSRGGLSISCNGSLLPRPGASGGSGGTGGCGGRGGGGGGAGGSSIALVSLNADVLLTSTVLVAGRGGDGGRGGAGQPGGVEGAGGDGGAAAGGVAAGCSGGAGGRGGAGGPGGGGQGGHSLGIAFKGKRPIGGKLAVDAALLAGLGGAAGIEGIQSNAGRGNDGVAAEALEFP
ncbi:hypothetical protein [Polyangium aurulentum]|uniref:hypothetical protein n=1 Tax=Polyangium aurulentum TaxID=2567896 RepID=UPI00200F02A9|nr:hypothetical protein [Polyangium aurulentum]UQA57223.1 hypothetical protein E8A73_038950 [Polyangium aurulentum]